MAAHQHDRTLRFGQGALDTLQIAAAVSGNRDAGNGFGRGYAVQTREGPVQKIVKNIPGGKITIRSQDEDAPAETPIRVDITAQCQNGRMVTVLKNYRTCEFLGVRTLKDGSGFDLQELKFGGGTCSIGNTSRIQTYDLCQ